MMIYGKTDIGRHRSSNQDEFAYSILNERVCFGLVCDGMGGENGGQVASAIAAQTIYEILHDHLTPELTDEQVKAVLVQAVSRANEAIYRRSLQQPEYLGMGTTAVVAAVLDGKGYVVHVGDSRAYRFKAGELSQITKDHSLVQSLVEQGKITQEQAKDHPQKHMITRAVGVASKVDIDFVCLGDIGSGSILLCSDGLSGLCDQAEMEEILLSTPPNQVCEALVDQANQNGGFDNITAVYLC
ncbi:MAG TPA: Stp1/IreP family PP2C-type Ser/Thr phosphatase [Candidatus Egerieicola pullicola]|uniref:Stp1/IreP family PP2C-type Ser/Thr phosphatase n=1 Tax=Candidatus Egerieicola pullicola TaxID=2840775 RepID=A0A9D1AJC8_9FIRM|nr:Stp1/IreP family PP2C-type Ser/Thr phosphatase [Candidatus Egerieicola pullicola]